MRAQEINCHAQPRNIALDILRLTAMLMVTLLHITGHGLQEAQIEPFSSAYWITLILNTFSLVAVNSFVLISGYFLSEKNSSPQKIAALWFQVWIYSVMIYVILCLIPGIDVHFRASTLVECMFPLLSNQYWFFTCYFLLYLMTPILNRLVRSWDQREYRNALIVLIVVFSLLPSVNIWTDSFGTNNGYSIIWFVVLYLLGAYLRRFDFQCPVHPIFVYLAPCAALCVLQAVVKLWNTDMGSVQALLANQCSYNGPLVLCASIGLFAWARSAAPRPYGPHMRMIASMGTLSFGVYLLHDHGAIRAVLWNDWARLKDVTAHGGEYLLRIVLVLILVFASGLAVEFVRRKVAAGIYRIFKKINLTGKSKNEAKKQN